MLLCVWVFEGVDQVFQVQQLCVMWIIVGLLVLLVVLVVVLFVCGLLVLMCWLIDVVCCMVDGDYVICVDVYLCDEFGELVVDFNYFVVLLEVNQKMWCQFMVDILYELCMFLVVLCGELEVLEDGVCLLMVILFVLLQVEVLMFSKFIDDLYELLLVDVGVFVFYMELFDLVDIVCSVVQGFMLCLMEKGIVLQLDVLVVFLYVMMVKGDVQCLCQVMQNLLENMLCYIDVGGMLCVYVYQDGDWQQIDVQDSVLGVFEVMLLCIFDCLFCVDVLCSWVQGGVGLGLSLCQIIVVVYGGIIDVRYLLLGGLWIVICLLIFDVFDLLVDYDFDY